MINASQWLGKAPHPLDYKRYQKVLQKKVEIIWKISKTSNYFEQRKERYKPYKYLFESIKQKTNKSHFSKQILLYKNNRQKTWNVMKEIISKMYQHNKSKLPRKPIAHEIEIA